MVLALLLALAQTPSPITVQINHDRFATGDRARVYVEPTKDGYLVVLHADPYGRVRVLFPLDPTDDDFIRGGQRQELRGRADRDAFVVDDDDGTGTVLAAWMAEPFKYDEFIRNGHWDYRVLRNDSIKNDPLSGLLDVVQRMAGTGHFEYDAVTYVVARSRIASRYGYGDDYYDYGYGYPYHFGFGIGFGYPYGYGCGYFCNPFSDPFCYKFYRPRPYVFRGVFIAGRTNTNYVIPRDRPRYVPTQPRPRDTFSGPHFVEPRVSRGSGGGSHESPSARSSGGGRSSGRESFGGGRSLGGGRSSGGRGSFGGGG